MLSKRHESTEVDRRTWLHVPLGLSGPPAVTLLIKLINLIIYFLWNCVIIVKTGCSYPMCSSVLIKVSGATARWPFTDSAVPSSLLLRSAGLQPADLLLILLFLPHYYYYYYYSYSNIFSNSLSEANIRATVLKFAQNV